VKKLTVIVVVVITFCLMAFTRTTLARTSKARPDAKAVLAQTNAARAEAHSPMATSTCSFTFTSGNSTSFLKYCVTANGNITQLETPEGKEHIAVGAAGEGYGICDLNPTGQSISYFDYADFGDSGNWNPSTVVSQTTKVLKIARTTSDGIWTLTQPITQASGSSPSVKLGLVLTNNSSTERSVFLIRYADVDASGSVLNSLDGTAKSAFGWNSAESPSPFGLVLENTGPFPFLTSPLGLTQNVPGGPNPCNFAAHLATGTQTATDGSILLLYARNLPKHASKTVTVSYGGF
jgi:hypothetical protein